MRFWPLVFAFTAACAFGQDVAPVFTGRLESSWNWTDASGGQTTGFAAGWTGFTGGTKDVKTELRLGLSSWPTPSVNLARAWVKFRVPGARFTTGLGRLAWGTGLVLVPGDLLFDSVDSPVDFQSDELRTDGVWLGDAWFALGDEAFVEAAALADAVGARVSAAPGGVTLEAAGAWDRSGNTAKAALSAQAHWMVDWYATVRQDVSTDQPTFSLERSSGGAGAFGLWDLGEGRSLTSRHEVWASDPEAPQIKSYHDLFLALDSSWTVGARMLVTAFPASGTPSAEVRWSGLQNLTVFAVVLPVEPRAVSLGCLARW